MPQSLDPFLAPAADSADTASLLIELVDHLDAMLAYWDSKQVCRFANMAHKDWFGRGRNELLGTTLRELLGPLYGGESSLH
ncbi:PAS domain-containing protein [Paucibacter sp. O1-1]|nr:PAS domain-containing protein [Paucibacter sp. O1-1]MDA3830907.1 PAS domain-containing protein [Paucibacter sp. O1-1]